MTLQEHNISNEIDDIIKSHQVGSGVRSSTDKVESNESGNSKPTTNLVELPDQNKLVIPPQKKKSTKKKCAREGCKRRVNIDNGEEFCEDHQPKEPLTPEQIQSGKIALYNLHLSVYMATEMISGAYTGNSRFKLDGLTNLLIEQKEQIEQIHENLIEYYGIENIEQLCNPILALAMVTTGHIITVVKDNNKKNGGQDGINQPLGQPPNQN